MFRLRTAIDFNPRLPRGRRLYHFPCVVLDTGISIHASLVGGDKDPERVAGLPIHFNPRLPRGRRRQSMLRWSAHPSFQSTPPSWEATVSASRRHGEYRFQSTPPSWEATGGERAAEAAQPPFQSTPPSWEATCAKTGFCETEDFNPRLPRGRRPRQEAGRARAVGISIHASLVGGDTGRPRPVCDRAGFQSTPPSWEATSAISWGSSG